MSLQSVQAFLAQHSPDIAILQTAEPTATVLDAARVHGVAPARIAKGLPKPLRVFAELSLRRFEVVLPAAGAVNAAVLIEPERLGAVG